MSPRWLQHESCVLSLSHLDYNGCSRRRLGACRAEAASIDIGVHVGKEVDPGAKNFEDNLDERIVDIMYGDDSDKEGDAEENRSLSPARLSLLESNVKILEDKCHVRKIILEAAKAKAGNLYLGLDISTQNTGYTVLAPAATESTTADVDDDTADDEAFLRERLGARLVEWGCIVGSGKRARDKKDVVDVGIIIEERLREVAERCSGSRGENETRATEAGLVQESERRASGSEDEGRGKGDTNSEGPVWVVGVEDFMRRFLPGKSNARSIFALAQLNGIVMYACQKYLGAKAEAFHPSRARSFYGLLSNKPEGKEMKEIVHDFALAIETGGLESRQDWPVLEDGSKTDKSNVDTSGNYDVTDSYLVARYSWHQDIWKEVVTNEAAKARFVESYTAFHVEKLKSAEEKAVALLMAGEMPNAKRGKKQKALTEREARNKHRKLQAERVTKAYETALLHWFRQRV